MNVKLATYTYLCELGRTLYGKMVVFSGIGLGLIFENKNVKKLGRVGILPKSSFQVLASKSVNNNFILVNDSHCKLALGSLQAF